GLRESTFIRGALDIVSHANDLFLQYARVCVVGDLDVEDFWPVDVIEARPARNLCPVVRGLDPLDRNLASPVEREAASGELAFEHERHRHCFLVEPTCNG